RRARVAARALPRTFELGDLAGAPNAMLPDAIAVLEAAEVDEQFDPRRDARLRIYESRVLNRALRSFFVRNSAWLAREPLDVDAMNAAAAEFVGEHDFA